MEKRSGGGQHPCQRHSEHCRSKLERRPPGRCPTRDPRSPASSWRRIRFGRPEVTGLQTAEVDDDLVQHDTGIHAVDPQGVHPSGRDRELEGLPGPICEISAICGKNIFPGICSKKAMGCPAFRVNTVGGFSPRITQMGTDSTGGQPVPRRLIRQSAGGIDLDKHLRTSLVTSAATSFRMFRSPGRSGLTIAPARPRISREG